MKQFAILFFMTAFLAVSAQETNFKEFYNNHQEAAELSLTLPLSLVKNFVDEDDIDKDILDKAKSFKILIFSNDNSNVKSDFKKFSKKNKLKTLVRAKDGKDKAELFFTEEGDFINEIIVVAGSNKEQLVFMGLKTEKMTRDELVAIVADQK